MKRFNKIGKVRRKLKIKLTALKEERSIRSYVWMYFICFTVFILVLLWLFQYVFLASYYRSAKIRDIKKSAKEIVYNIDSQDTAELRKISRRLAFDNGLCILITDNDDNQIIFENNIGNFSVLGNDVWGTFLYQLKNDLIKNNSSYITKTLKNENSKSEEVFFCTTVKSKNYDAPLYLYIEGTIQPIESTVNIIREQLIYITIILFELAFIITMFISKRLSKPIVEITKTAKKFGEGDYSVDFNAKGYREIEELSTVLDNAKNEIQKVSDLRKDLIANISHDLRTPLTIVKSYAEMIRDFSGENPEKRNEHISVIIDETDRLSGLVNNLLELSKLESGNMEMNITEFSIHEKMHDIMLRYQLLIENDGYDIQFIPDEDRVIAADEEKLDQVMYNFINNAVNYCGDDKVIRIRQINKPDVVRFEIIDHGKGISKELLPLIFDRYYRDAKYKREVVGTGLGLSICQEILKKHNFAFGVQSEEGKGSTFWFEANIAFHKKERTQRHKSNLNDDIKINRTDLNQ